MPVSRTFLIVVSTTEHPTIDLSPTQLRRFRASYYASGIRINVKIHASAPEMLDQLPGSILGDLLIGNRKIAPSCAETAVANRIHLRFDEDSKSLFVDVPIACPNQLFFQSRPNCLLISNRPECANEDCSQTVSERALFSLLQFGSVVPPFSIFEGVARFRPGISTKISLSRFAVDEIFRYEPSLDPSCFSSLQSCNSFIAERIDDIVTSACATKKAALLFSGGIDSTYLAFRALQLGKKPFHLFHYSIGSQNADTICAKRIAAKLGFELTIFDHDLTSCLWLLEHPKMFFSQPFSDHSVLVTGALANRICRESSPHDVVLDGTGADGLFAVGGRAMSWEKVYMTPAVIRDLAKVAYFSLGLPARRRTRMELICRVLARSTKYERALAAVLCQNPLMGYAFDFSEDCVAEVVYEVNLWRDMMAASDIAADDIHLDMMGVCANIYAQKARLIFADNNIEVVFPFLDPKLIHYVTYSDKYAVRFDKKKQFLKDALNLFLDDYCLRRKKQGFFANPSDTFSSSFVRGIFYEKVFCAQNPILPFLRRNEVQSLFEAASRERDIPAQTFNFLWATVISSCWLLDDWRQ